MQLFARLRWPWIFSIGAAALGLLATLIIVWSAGARVFADYAIDLAKLSLVVLVFEIVPSPFAITRSQQDGTLKRDLATFSLVASVPAIMLTIALNVVGLFSHYSYWMLLYVGYLAAQRYFDVKLQAEGRLGEFFQLTSAATAFRVTFLAGGFAVFQSGAPSDVVWGALSLGSIFSLVSWLCVRPEELEAFRRFDHIASARRLIEGYRSYAPYYLNVALKRVRDSAMPILCGALVTSTAEIARYLLAYRGLDFVCGQLRVSEALLANFAARREMQATRRQQFLTLAVAGQLAAFAASALLGGQTGFDRDLLALSFVASFFVYPYVVELVFRSDAYAEIRPMRVTVSLSANVSALGTVMAVLALSSALTAPALVLAPLAGQTAAAVTYLFARKSVQPT